MKHYVLLHTPGDLSSAWAVFRFDETSITWQPAIERGWGENDPSFAEYTHGGAHGAMEVTEGVAAEIADRIFHHAD